MTVYTTLFFFVGAIDHSRENFRCTIAQPAPHRAAELENFTSNNGAPVRFIMMRYPETPRKTIHSPLFFELKHLLVQQLLYREVHVLEVEPGRGLPGVPGVDDRGLELAQVRGHHVVELEARVEPDSALFAGRYWRRHRHCKLPIDTSLVILNRNRVFAYELPGSPGLGDKRLGLGASLG